MQNLAVFTARKKLIIPIEIISIAIAQRGVNLDL